MVKAIIVSVTIIIVCITTIIVAKLQDNRRGVDSVRDKLQRAGEGSSEAKQAVTNAERGTQESLESARRLSELIEDSSRIINKVRNRKSEK